jgi:hypothetical protein
MAQEHPERQPGGLRRGRGDRKRPAGRLRRALRAKGGLREGLLIACTGPLSAIRQDSPIGATGSYGRRSGRGDRPSPDGEAHEVSAVAGAQSGRHSSGVTRYAGSRRLLERSPWIDQFQSRTPGARSPSFAGAVRDTLTLLWRGEGAPHTRGAAPAEDGAEQAKGERHSVEAGADADHRGEGLEGASGLHGHGALPSEAHAHVDSHIDSRWCQLRGLPPTRPTGTVARRHGMCTNRPSPRRVRPRGSWPRHCADLEPARADSPLLHVGRAGPSAVLRADI